MREEVEKRRNSINKYPQTGHGGVKTRKIVLAVKVSGNGRNKIKKFLKSSERRWSESFFSFILKSDRKKKSREKKKQKLKIRESERERFSNFFSSFFPRFSHVFSRVTEEKVERGRSE